MLRVPSNFAARAAYRPGQRLTTSAAHPPKAIRAFSVEETGRYRDRYRWPRRCTREKRIGSTMYALDVLPRSQQSERSRRWAAGSTSPTVRVPIASDSDIVFARQQGRAFAAASTFPRPTRRSLPRLSRNWRARCSPAQVAARSGCTRFTRTNVPVSSSSRAIRSRTTDGTTAGARSHPA